MGSSRKKKKRNRLSGLFSYDTSLIVAVVFLTVFGLIMIYSASYYVCSIRESYNYDPAYLMKNQLKWSLVGLGVMLVVANIDYHRWRFLAVGGFLGSIVLILLLKTGMGVTVKGATRWLMIPGLGQFQVAEPIKVAMIIFAAALIAGRISRLQSGTLMQQIKQMVIILIPVTIVAGLIYKISNNLSTATIVMGIVCIMLFVVHPKYWPFLLIIFAGSLLVGIYLYSMAHAPADAAEGGFRSGRIMAWLNPYAYESDEAYQALQSLYAIGSGGLFGKGPGNSIQKLGRIPEPYNDMIFAIVCEELGVFGAGLVILLFIYLLYRLYCITQQADDLFGRLLAIGVFGHVALQVILNLMVVTSLFPTTGVTLPFFSAGGTATVFLFIEFGIVLNVEKVARRKREEQERRLEREL